MVMDDLKVAPMSTISGITLLSTFGITDIGMLQEKTVQLDYEQGLKILKASLQSKTVLTDVFLLLVAKEAQVVVLAEAGKDVVDFLLGLLAMPVGAVVKLLGRDKDGALAALASLYGSVQRMDAEYMQSPATRDALLSPAPAHPALVAAAGGFPSLVQPVPAPPGPAAGAGKARLSSSLKSLAALPPLGIGGACHCPACLAAQEQQGSRGFVRARVTFTVMDDLTVTPMSNISSITLLHKLALEERTVKIGYQEVSRPHHLWPLELGLFGLEILRASLRSKTVLTDVFLTNKKKRAREKNGATQQQEENRAPDKNGATTQHQEEKRARIYR
ncbi:hypothetical protein U9M48_020811 [Paspalum notatum var. saurae]|uniref:Uncharacterized protein n=1 Tax=Paspalum notatum var. saurae TaxID=547442 RepID=A0AAQ3WT75_PASNO